MSAPVVVGVDGGESGTDALLLGRWVADTLGEPLIVAVVHPAPAPISSGRVDAEWVADRHRAAEAVLDGARKVLAGIPGEVQYRSVASSSAAHGLHDLADALWVVADPDGSLGHRQLEADPAPSGRRPGTSRGPAGWRPGCPRRCRA